MTKQDTSFNESNLLSYKVGVEKNLIICLKLLRIRTTREMTAYTMTTFYIDEVCQ